MGRFETLNLETQDQVEAMLPAIAKAYNIDDVKEIIPEDIRMRVWECEKRFHIKDQTEDDPRNWGVQFLKDLRAIARLLNGDLERLQADIRDKIAKHKDNHPWCRLADIKELKKRYQNPDVVSDDGRDPEEYVEEYASSTDSYFEELVEQELPKGSRRHINNEAYEVQQQSSQKKRKRKATSRLRRDSGGWERSKKRSRDPVFRSVEERTSSHSVGNIAPLNYSNPPTDSAPSPPMESPAPVLESFYQPNVPLEVQRLQAELEVAEAELNYARLKVKFFEAKQREQDMGSQNDLEQYDDPTPSYLD